MMVILSKHNLATLTLLSLLLHLITLWWLGVTNDIVKTNKKAKARPVKIKVFSTKKKTEPKRIIETPQKKTEAPDNPKFKGAQNHKAKKQTKVKRRPQNKTLDPGRGGIKKRTKTKKKKKKASTKPTQKKVKDTTGHKPRNPYEALLPIPHQDMFPKPGYQDTIDDDDIEEGERVDLDTSEYRYIGYFTSFRKAFQMVWSYPREAARRGLSGTAHVEFIINKDGTLRTARVVKTSGFKILDDAVLYALKNAGPYNPLPDGISKKNRLVVTGRFTYHL